GRMEFGAGSQLVASGGRALVHGRWPDGHAGIAIRAVTLSGKERVVATAPGMFALSDLSREGRVLMARGSTRVTTVFGGQGLERARDLSWSEESQTVGLSDDGKTILLDCAGFGACLRGTDGGPVVRLGDGVPIGLSPDGKWITAETKGHVLTL